MSPFLCFSIFEDNTEALGCMIVASFHKYADTPSRAFWEDIHMSTHLLVFAIIDTANYTEKVGMTHQMSQCGIVDYGRTVTVSMPRQIWTYHKCMLMMSSLDNKR